MTIKDSDYRDFMLVIKKADQGALRFELLDHVIEWMKGYLLPEDVFYVETLETWAKENGWVKGEA